MHMQKIVRLENGAGAGVTILSGHASTGPRGFWQFSLDEVFPSEEGVDENIAVVATPLETGTDRHDTQPRPVFLVAKRSGRTISVWSFTVAGVWAPSVGFAFQCIRHE